MRNDWFQSKSHGKLVLILAILAYFMLMFGNGIVSLTHPDEVFYIQSAKEMVARNSWFTPMIFDEVQFEKPFVSFALFGVAIKFFGLTSSAARFWPSFFGVLGVGVVYWISWILFRRKRAAFLSGTILTSSFIYMALSRAVLTDMIFSVMVATSIGFFTLAYYNRKYKTQGIIWCAVVSAIAVLTKGLLGVCMPALTIIFFLFYKKDFGFLKDKAVAWGAGLFFLIALPWHIAMYMQHGNFFLEEYFYNVHWRRILAAEHKRLDNWYFYIMLMFVGVIPWFLFWIPTLRHISVQFKKNMAGRDKLFFLLAWVGAVYMLVQPAHSKLASYIFPAFPAIAIILAYYLDRALSEVDEGKVPQALRFCGFVMSGVLLCIAIGGIIVAKHFPTIILDMKPIYGGAVFVLFIASCLVIFNLRRQYVRMIFSYLGISVTLLGMLFFARPYIEPWVSCKPICDVFKKLDQSNTPVLASKFYVRGIRFYTDRPMAVIDINGNGFWSPHPIPFLNKDEMVIDFLSERDVTWAILKEGNVQDMRRILNNQSYRMEMFDDIGGKAILRITKIN